MPTMRDPKEQGAVVWEELNETVDGERQYGVRELDGHRWLFSRHAHDIAPQDWGAMVAGDSHQAGLRPRAG